MNTAAIEAYLALLYTDRAACAAFLADPAAAARAAGLGGEEVAEMVKVDPRALRLAARGFARKRAARGVPASWWGRVLRLGAVLKARWRSRSVV